MYWKSMTFEDFDWDNILIDEKSHENVLIYDISYKTLIVLKPLRMRFDEIHGFIRNYNGNRYSWHWKMWCCLQ